MPIRVPQGDGADDMTRVTPQIENKFRAPEIYL